MAYIQTTKYMEECCGAMMPVYESELICDDEEVADVLVEKIIADGLVYSMENLKYKEVTLIDNYNEEDIDVETKDFLDIDSLESWYEGLTEEEAEAWENKPESEKEIDLYAALGLLRPESRRKYSRHKDGLGKVLSKEHLELGVKNVIK